jgi:adenylate cyclase
MGLWAALGAIAIATQPPWVQRAEGQAQALLLALRGPVPAPDNVVILGIDEESLTQGDLYRAAAGPEFPQAALQTWPLPRAAYATVIENLTAAGAQVVAIDVLMVDPSVYGPADDARLQQVLDQQGDRVVLAAAYDTTASTGGQLVQLLTPIYAENSAEIGVVNFPVDSDQRLRRLPDPFITALANQSQVAAPGPSFARTILATAAMPVQEPRGPRIHFYGPTGSFATVPFWHVLDPNNWAFHQAQRTFAGKLVLIGPTAASLQDIKLTPTANTMPGVEVHAHTLATLMEGRALGPITDRRWLSAAMAGLLLGLGGADPGLASQSSPAAPGGICRDRPAVGRFGLRAADQPPPLGAPGGARLGSGVGQHHLHGNGGAGRSPGTAAHPPHPRSLRGPGGGGGNFGSAR